MSGTLVFASESNTVVADASDRRDARSTGREPAAAGAGRGKPGSTFDLPPLDEPTRPDGGELVN